MTPKLYAARYDDYDYSGENPVEVFQDVQELGIRWNLLKHGIQRIELTIRAESEFDAYDRFKNHLGHLIAVFDSYIDRCVTGNVYEVALNGRSVTYLCAGPSRRLNNLLYYVTDMSDLTLPTDDTDVTIKDIIDDRTQVINTDQSNIDATSNDTGAWKPGGFVGGYKDTTGEDGMFSGDAIRELAAIGNSAGGIMDFYLVDAPLDGIQIQKPLPYLKARSSTASPDWQFNKEDIAEGGLTLGRNIWDLANYLMVGYGRLTGTHDGGNSAHLIDSTASFEADGVILGDRVVNVTTGKSGTVEAFVDAVNDDELDLTNHPAGTEWSNNDVYSIELRDLQWTTQVTNDDFWIVAARPKRPELDATQAALFRSLYHGQYREPLLQQSFVIGAPKIKDGNGALWPLWRPMFMPSGTAYFRVNDLFPEAALFSTSNDREKAFLAVTMDYQYSSNRLRVVPATIDSRLDVLMAQALADKKRISEIVSVE